MPPAVKLAKRLDSYPISTRSNPDKRSRPEMLVVLRTLLLCQLAMLCDLAFGKCLTDLQEVNPKSYFSVQEGRCQIVIQSSQRVSHNITSNIFKILLDEVIGYESVKIVERYDYFSPELPLKALLDNKYHPYTYNDSKCPRASVNLEIWVSTVKDLDQMVNYPVELGTISTPGRFGWFVLRKPLESGSLDSIHWKLFQNPETASEFHINPLDAGIDLEKIAVNKKGDKYSCSPRPCRTGVYTPERCKTGEGDSDKCALLISGEYDVTYFVVNDIEYFGLYVKVIWVGGDLKNVTNNLMKNITKGRAVILSWTPGDVIVSADFVPVSFPPCKGDNVNSPGCRYEYYRLVKSASRSLKIGAQSAYTAAADMYLNHTQYTDLLRTYTANPNLSHYEIACNWMRENQPTWRRWNQHPQNELKILAIFPLDSAYNGGPIADAAEMAVKAINNNTSVLRDMTLHLIIQNGNCDSDSVINNFIQTVLAKDDFDKTIGILGPACSHTVDALIGVCKYFETVAISYSAEGSAFSDRTKYRYFFRTIGDNQGYILAYLNLMKRLGWKRMASLTEAGQTYTQYIPHLIKTMESNNLTFIYNSEIPRKGDNIVGVRSNLEALKSKGARIIVAHVYNVTARAVMCEAYRLNMTAADGYVWFLPQWLNPRWYEARKGDDCTTEELVEALNGHFSLAPAYFAPDHEIMQENITVAEWKKNFLEDSYGWSDYAGYAYDAVWVFALAYDELYRKNAYTASKIHAHSSAGEFIDIIEKIDFMGVSGRVNFVSGSSRVSVVNILQWMNRTTRIIGSFHPNETLSGSNTGHRFELNLSVIHWLTRDGKQPGDGTELCALQALSDILNVTCGVAIVVTFVLGSAIVGVIAMMAFYVYTKHKYDRKMREFQKTQERMKSWRLDVFSPNPTDKWEIPRDHLVINRKLNEGAFGTVYGGEAYFHDGGWVAAAVKTLKVNSTTEQKLDFLSEAEIMKKLDHKNIVKLLGVCTKQEPIYTVMEFMLYGDLKTFLLARRHLVNNKKLHEESDEISSKKLTAMALDVARGLSYLAQLKYVHRDIASRNCLINYARVVKIGDFGMTRSMFDSDYYKFSRKGMLPVRWMAPESLGLGIFTPASDIWSYGVLLYEIITFGSFPFQGLSNNQVMEHVKSGNTLTIPSGIKPQLEFLMKSCWNLDFKLRPQASAIVEFLANNPRLISPSLDVPLSSVVMEDTGQLELNIPEIIRKSSMSSKSKNDDSGGGIRQRTASHSSEPFSLSVPPYLEETTFYPNGYNGQSENCPWIPLLNNGRNGSGEGSSRSSSIGTALGKIITVHRSESCEDCGEGDPRAHQTSL